VAQQVVREQQVACPATDLLRLGQAETGMRHIQQGVRPVRAQVRGKGMMCSGPNPKVAHVLAGLVGQEHAREQRERAGPPAWFGRRQTVEVRAAGPVIARRDVERDLDLAWRLDPQRPDQRLSGGKSGAGGE